MYSFSVRAPTWHRFIGELTSKKNRDDNIYVFSHDTDQNELSYKCMDELIEIQTKHHFAGWFFNVLKANDFMFDKVEPAIEESVALNEAFKHMLSLYGQYEGLFERLDDQIVEELAIHQVDDYTVSRYQEVRDANQAFYKAYLIMKDVSAVMKTSITRDERTVSTATITIE